MSLFSAGQFPYLIVRLIASRDRDSWTFLLVVDIACNVLAVVRREGVEKGTSHCSECLVHKLVPVDTGQVTQLVVIFTNF